MDGHAAPDEGGLPERSADPDSTPRLTRRSMPRTADIAITGMSAIMPGAPDLRRFWENILDKVCVIEEVPAERWPAELYYDPDQGAPDKINSKWGGFIADTPFDPTRFGIPPASVPSIDPGQLLALVAAEAALADAGLTEMTQELRRRASVILGFTGGLGEVGVQYAARAELARAVPAAPTATLDFLPAWSSDSFAGLLPNVVAGRIANRFDFGGSNFVVDAACAASLAAVRQAVIELETGRSDVVLCGAVETGQGPFAFTCFSKAQALSPRGKCRAFDADADGTAISEGIAMLVLRRLEDAQAAGDRIYAVIKGIDGSSDGRARGLMAPLPEGQKRALRRAYDQAGYASASVDLFEAHGTGTVAGDAAEIESLSSILVEHGAGARSCAVGSVKTLIGHAKGAAGLAGLVKVVLALHHRVLPPHAGVERPNPALAGPDCPIALYQDARPWLPRQDGPRRAGVSAFGFGGANYHVTLEESAATPGAAPRDRWPVELFVWRAADFAGVGREAATALARLQAGARPDLGSLAKALSENLGNGSATLALVTGTHDSLASLLTQAIAHLGKSETARPLPAGLYLSDKPLSADGKVAMLFPGQGSQYPDMARDLAVTFPEVAAALADADTIVAATPTYKGRQDPRISRLVYPSARFGDAEVDAAQRALAATDVAQPALGAVEAAMLALVERLKISPAMMAGHSYGEYVALHAAGVLSRRDLLRLSEARGRSIVEATRDGDLGTMAAVAADVATVRGVLGSDAHGVVVANLNAPAQTVISGGRAAIARALDRLASHKVHATAIPVSAAFHSPLMQPAQAPLVRFFDEVSWSAPRLPVYANTTASPHGTAPAEIRALLERHLTEPVDFVGMVEAMYKAGARVFLEVGPKSVLTGLTRRILGSRPHRAVSLDGAGGGVAGLLHALGAMMVDGVCVDLARLFEGRRLSHIDLATWQGADEDAKPAKGLWLVNSTRARKQGADVRTAAVRPEAAAEGRNSAAPGVTPSAPLRRPGKLEARATAGHATQRQTRNVKETDMHGYQGPVRTDDDGPRESLAGGPDRAMADHQDTMRQFLHMQERLMLAYLGGGERQPRPFSTPRPTPPLRTALSQPIAAVAPAQAPPAVPAAVRPVPAAAPPPAPAPSEPVAGPVQDPKTLLLKIASERTGYPEDMLDLDLNMEADLGIDSIKRVEILAAFRKAQPAAVSDHLQPHMTRIAKSMTLREVLDRVRDALADVEGAKRPFEQAGTERAAAALARYVIRPAAENLPDDCPATVARGIYLVLPDTGGIAPSLIALLERDGATARLVPEHLTRDDAATERWLVSVREDGRIRGVVSLASLDAPPSDGRTIAAWRQGMETSVKSLFVLLRLAAPDLAADGTVLVASMMGGLFARDLPGSTPPATFFPGAGGGVGLIKSLAMEWPGCRCKAIDLDPSEGTMRGAAHLHAEIAARVGRREVGYPGGQRTIFRTEAAALQRAQPLTAIPDQGWVVLAIGGARGITAETLRPFAAAGAVCVVVGRSPLPGAEAADTAPLADAKALRAHFLAEAAAAGTRVTPAKIEARIGQVLRDREIRANMADFAALGAKVDYRLCDVLQEAEVASLFESTYATYGKIDAVLYGAGTIEDRLIVDKSRESLSRVFDTKVDGAFFVTQNLRPETLKFLALFSSVAGRYGNRGQTDYAAANEVLNRFAWELQARFGTQTKVTSVNWGAWAGTTNGAGMLTPETARQFRERGLRLIEADEGRDFLWDELLYAPRGEIEVVAGEHAWDAQEDAAAAGS